MYVYVNVCEHMDFSDFPNDNGMPYRGCDLQHRWNNELVETSIQII